MQPALISTRAAKNNDFLILFLIFVVSFIIFTIFTIFTIERCVTILFFLLRNDTTAHERVVTFLELDQFDALCGTTGLTDRRDIHADRCSGLGDEHQVVFVRHTFDTNQVDLLEALDSMSVSEFIDQYAGSLGLNADIQQRLNQVPSFALNLVSKEDLRQVLASVLPKDTGNSLAGRLQSVRLMSRQAAFATGNREGYTETYHYFAMFVEFLLLVWMYLTICRGGVA